VYNLSIYHMIEGDSLTNDGSTLKSSLLKVGADHHSLIPITVSDLITNSDLMKRN
jgi:hypothetical protein